MVGLLLGELGFDFLFPSCVKKSDKNGTKTACVNAPLTCQTKILSIPYQPRLQTEQKNCIFVTLILFLSHQEFFSIWSHVELKRKREVCIHLLLHHGHHVEGIAHSVETKDARENLETGPAVERTKERRKEN